MKCKRNRKRGNSVFNIKHCLLYIIIIIIIVSPRNNMTKKNVTTSNLARMVEYII